MAKEVDIQVDAEESPVKTEKKASEELDETKKELGRLKKVVGRMRLITWIKLGITLFIIIGMIVYVLGVYGAASSLALEDQYISEVKSAGGLNQYEATVVLVMSNPTSTPIEIEFLSYSAYIEEDFIGSGYKQDFIIAPGLHELDFSLTFDLSSLSDPTQTLFFEGEADLKVEGKVTVPVKVFDLFKYTEITLPFSITQQITTDSMSPGDGPPAPVILSEPAATGLNSVRLAWTMSLIQDFHRYEVHMDTSPNIDTANNTSIATLYSNSTTTYEVTGLDRANTYYFKIVVWDVEGLFAESNEASHTFIVSFP
ncbi:MAG: hypothetical protein QCI38_01600 [Candidatus Thermoplasmatota archaeon]|nr:hypothetical protein [Candidatus Thermoplasmatota archaeon]